MILDLGAAHHFHIREHRRRTIQEIMAVYRIHDIFLVLTDDAFNILQQLVRYARQKLSHNPDISYTTVEIAKLLKISKLTVYDLIKRGELPSYRVGKQMRVDASDLEAYKQQTRMAGATERYAGATERYAGAAERLAGASSLAPPTPSTAAGSNRPVVITGHDIGLDILAKHMEKEIPGIRPLRSFVGSLDSLISMYKGESDIVSTHLFDGDTGEYNIPCIRKLLVGSSYVVVSAFKKELETISGYDLSLTGKVLFET